MELLAKEEGVCDIVIVLLSLSLSSSGSIIGAGAVVVGTVVFKDVVGYKEDESIARYSYGMFGIVGQGRRGNAVI